MSPKPSSAVSTQRRDRGLSLWRISSLTAEVASGALTKAGVSSARVRILPEAPDPISSHVGYPLKRKKKRQAVRNQPKGRTCAITNTRQTKNGSTAAITCFNETSRTEDLG
jgi:hypothetical protein